jgi:hypothetical protein
LREAAATTDSVIIIAIIIITAVVVVVVVVVAVVSSSTPACIQRARMHARTHASKPYSRGRLTGQHGRCDVV